MRTSVKLLEMPEYSTAATYTPKKGGDPVLAFRVDRKDIGKRPPPEDRREVRLRVILPEYKDENGKRIGEGGSVSVWDGDWLIKRGDTWTVIDEREFESEYGK